MESDAVASKKNCCVFFYYRQKLFNAVNKRRSVSELCGKHKASTFPSASHRKSDVGQIGIQVASRFSIEVVSVAHPKID